jgi:hypothetical protein
MGSWDLGSDPSEKKRFSKGTRLLKEMEKIAPESDMPVPDNYCGCRSVQTVHVEVWSTYQQ